MAERNVTAILYGASPFFQVISERLIALAARYRIPALYEWREFVTAGVLMSYSTDRNEFGREAGMCAARILKGEKAGDLPVVQSSRFELVINLRTAKALGLEVPPTLLGGGASAWPLVARGQPALPVIGFLDARRWGTVCAGFARVFTEAATSKATTSRFSIAVGKISSIASLRRSVV